MDENEIRSAAKVVGTKQTMRMVEKSLCKRVIIAEDAREEILAPLLALCKTRGVEVTSVVSMAALGTLCGIKKGAASVGLL